MSRRDLLMVVEGRWKPRDHPTSHDDLLVAVRGQMEAEGPSNESSQLVGGGGRADGSQGYLDMFGCVVMAVMVMVVVIVVVVVICCLCGFSLLIV
jgi:hypothetical protein